MYSLSLLTSILLLLCTATFTAAENLQYVYSSSALPASTYYPTSVYDASGEYIYLLGTQETRDIVKYSILRDEVELAGSMGIPYYRGTAEWAGYGTAYYFGGQSPVSAQVWQINLNESVVGNATVLDLLLPRTLSSVSSVLDEERGDVYLFGGYVSPLARSDEIVRFSLRTNAVDVVGHLPSARDSTVAVWDKVGRKAYIFGGITPTAIRLNEIVRFDPDTGEVDLLPVRLPNENSGGCAVWVAGHEKAYLFGGTYDRRPLEFNPATNEVATPRVDNYPADLTQPGCAYSEQLSRIYILGNGTRIGYIELPTMEDPITTEGPEPTTTPRPITPVPDCSTAVDESVHPDPFCCKSFYACMNKEPILLSCPDGLHFSPSVNACMPAQLVRCGVFYSK